MGSPLPPPVAQMGAPYYHNQGQTLPHPGHVYPNVTSDPNGQNMRFALPVNDSRVMSGGRHKKEIKRRTKTGCLTCRKRRIKCDEQHPACRNCQKSKRECLGYDPIFKNNPGPAAIQPAPSSAPPQPVATITSGGNPYGNQPQMTGYGAPPTMPAYDPALTGAVSSPNTVAQPYDYTSAIDPSLEAAGPPPTAPTTAQLLKTAPAKRWTVAELLAIGGPPPEPLPPNSDATQSPAVIDEAKHLYYSIYAPGLESFLESKWFSVKGGTQLLIDKAVLEQFAVLLQQFAKTTNQNDPKEMAYTSSVEARIIWALAGMVKAGSAVAPKPAVKPVVPPSDDPVEAALRLEIFESLLTGEVAPGNALTRPVQGGNDPHKIREIEFWYTLAEFVAIDYENAAACKQIDETLSQLRNLLDGRENRDVLYSIAVVRAIGHRVSEYLETETPLHLDESDNRSKLVVAKKFVIDEANGNGTTNIIRRFCELAGRTWGHK